jgi:REP element-mobilizing transposase RayT
MAHRYPNVLIHCVFSTKTRLDLIPDALLPRLFPYLNGIGRNIKVPVIAAGGTANHIHMLIALPPDITVAKPMQTFKANSSRWMGEHGIKFAWQEGYGAFSVSASLRDTVRHYIEHQAEHHQKRSFEEEFAALLNKCGIHFDPAALFAD